MSSSSSRIGTLPVETSSATRELLPETGRASPSVALAKRHWAQTDADLVRTLTPLCASPPVLRRSGFPNTEVTGAKILCRSDCLGQARAILEQSLRPAPRELITAALAKLRVKTVRRADQSSDAAIEAEITVWAEELAEHPADVVISVLADWPDDKANGARKWWPAWAELKERIERAERGRRLLLWEVNRQIQRESAGAARVEPPQPETPEHRAKVVAECLAKLGMAVRPPPGEVVSGRQPVPDTEREAAEERLRQRRDKPPVLVISSPELRQQYPQEEE